MLRSLLNIQVEKLEQTRWGQAVCLTSDVKTVGSINTAVGLVSGKAIIQIEILSGIQ